MRKTPLALSALVVMIVPTSALQAQTSEQAAVIEEILVTARKRDEALQDIPASMTVFSASEIRSAGIETPHDFIALTPNVTLVQTQNAGNSFVNIRGVSQARNSEMSIAVLVDDVLMANPAQFNQELFDIEQIEVLRGPQGALYGRNAIGGAIRITTKEPTDEFEGAVEAGVGSGNGYKLRGAVGGPVVDNLKFRVAGSYVDTDGTINNPYLNEDADPYEDWSFRGKLLWDISDTFRADLRGYSSRLHTQALYFVIGPDADDTNLPVMVNNSGTNKRNMWGMSLKLDFEMPAGTLTSITAYDDLDELLTGDQFNFLPRPESFLNLDATGFGDFIRFLTGDAIVDLSQNQYLDVDAWSQEIRFTSPSDTRLRWIAGAYYISTDRYISTGNQIDRGFGVFNVRKTPRPSVFVDPSDPSPQLGLLADKQDNYAWAAFGEVAYDLAEEWELAVSFRYDYDERENTTRTLPLYDPTGLGLTYGDKRKEHWDDLQPKVTLRYRPNDNLTAYGSYSRGFRSGGFNQSGVGAAVPEPGVEDLFDDQTADSFEVGLKALLLDGRLQTSAAVYYTDFKGTYFFFFDPTTSTQNLGNVDKVIYKGFEIEANALLTDTLSAYVGLGYVDSDIKDASDPADEGNQAPLVTEYTLNLGAQYRQPLPLLDGNLMLVARADYRRLGDTYWDPGNISKRGPVDLLDVRLGVEVPDNWSITAWSKNATDEEYNAEFSPGPAPGANFLFKATERRWGVDFVKRF